MFEYVASALYKTNKDAYYEIYEELSPLAKEDIRASYAVTREYGDTFIGKAEVADYDGTVGGVGSFRTTTWVPLEATYKLIDGYDFRLKNGNSVDSFHLDSFSYTVVPNYTPPMPMPWVFETWDENAPVVILQLMNDAYRILSSGTYAGEGINHLQAVYDKYYWIYAYTGQPITGWPNSALKRFHPAMSDLYYAIVNVADEVGIKDTD